MSHVTHVTCHMSHVTCHMSHVTCHMLLHPLTLQQGANEPVYPQVISEMCSQNGQSKMHPATTCAAAQLPSSLQCLLHHSLSCITTSLHPPHPTRVSPQPNSRNVSSYTAQGLIVDYEHFLNLGEQMSTLALWYAPPPHPAPPSPPSLLFSRAWVAAIFYDAFCCQICLIFAAATGSFTCRSTCCSC